MSLKVVSVTVLLKVVRITDTVCHYIEGSQSHSVIEGSQNHGHGVSLKV